MKKLVPIGLFSAIIFALAGIGECSEPPDKSVVDAALGLCVFVGEAEDFQSVAWVGEDAGKRVWHCFTESESSAQNLRKEMMQQGFGPLVAETLQSGKLPHLDNIVNLVVLNNSKIVEQDEALRVLRPGGVLLTVSDETETILVKGRSSGVDEWTHQWHGTDGGLTTEQELGVPTGVQWLAGPLFAMAGRKSSTQTLVSSNGVNFYVTQNVLDNVGLPVEEMRQYLVARDAYNGLQIWQKPWTGPFVTGNGETNPRLIATPEMLYAVQQEQVVSGIDPQDGEVIEEFESEEPIDKIVYDGKSLFVQTNAAVVAVSSDLAREEWNYEGNSLSGLTVSDGAIYTLSSGRSPDGRFRHELICLESSTGKERFKVNTQPDVIAAQVRINFAKDGLVALQAHGFLHMFAGEDGRHLWTKTTEARPGKTYVDERYVGHFYRRGQVWMLTQNSPRESEGQNVWVALDPMTGAVKRELETNGDWPRTATPAKMGCQVLIASDRYVLIPRQSTYIDLDTGEKHSFKFTRGGCGLGFVPANGLLYSHPHACGCFSEAIRGFMGMHSNPLGITEDVLSERLMSFNGLAAGKVGSSSAGWTMHRAGPSRGAFLDVELVGELESAWSMEVCDVRSATNDAWRLRGGSPLTAATSGGELVYLADVNRGRVLAVQQETGEIVWDFFAAGRVDSTPTIFGDSCLFGSRDGFVYSLDRRSGSLNWKYRAAPRDQRLVAFGGVESSWPVAGSVLVQGNQAFVAAGRGPDADGGIHVTALAANSGKPLWEKVVNDSTFWGLSDYLVGGTGRVYLSNREFDVNSGDESDVPEAAEHLMGGKVGLLESSWTRHDLALRKNIQTWTASGVAGQLLAFGDNAKASWNAETKRLDLYADEHFEMELGDGEQITAMALCRNCLLVAGGRDRGNPLAGGFLRVVDLENGSVTQKIELSAEPAFDGMSLTGDGVYLALLDGQFLAFKTQNRLIRSASKPSN